MAPIGLVTQDALDDFGQVVEKLRPACDQSFDFSPRNFANHPLMKDSLPPLELRFFFSTILCYENNLRFSHPSTPIFMSNVDIKSAYRRGTMSSLYLPRAYHFLRHRSFPEISSLR